MNDKRCYLPTAIFGKFMNAGKVPEGYRWLDKQDGFPESVFVLAEKYAKSFQWISKAGTSIYKPVTAWIPLSGRERIGLFLQFLDAGDDDRGRPHTLRLKAAYVPPEAVRDNNDILLFLLVTDQGVDSDSPVITPSAISQEEYDNLEGFRAFLQQANLNLANQAVLLTSEPDTFSFRPPHSIKVINRSSWSLIQEIPAVQSLEATHSELPKKQIPTSHKTIPPKSSKKNMTKKIVALSLAANIILLICMQNFYERINNLNNEISQLNNKIEKMGKENQELKKENQELNTEKIKWRKEYAGEKANKKIEELEKEIKRLNLIRNQYESSFENIKKELDTLRDAINPDISIESEENDSP